MREHETDGDSEIEESRGFEILSEIVALIGALSTNPSKCRLLTSGEKSDLALANGMHVRHIDRVRICNGGFLGIQGYLMAPNGATSPSLERRCHESDRLAHIEWPADATSSISAPAGEFLAERDRATAVNPGNSAKVRPNCRILPPLGSHGRSNAAVQARLSMGSTPVEPGIAD